MSAARGSGPRWELRAAADRMMREARATNRGRPTGTATFAAPGFGSVLVTWDRPRRRYDVGTAAEVVARGQRMEVLEALIGLLARAGRAKAGAMGATEDAT